MQVPEVYPAQVAEDVCPTNINFRDYFMSGSIWCIFSAKFPDVPFDDFMSHKIEKNMRRRTLKRKMFSSNLLVTVFLMMVLIIKESVEPNLLLLCLPAKTFLRPRAPLSFPKLKLKLLILPKMLSTSICTNILVELCCDFLPLKCTLWCL
jgi:hypothetical protein